MKSARSQSQPIGALQLIEEAFATVRNTRGAVLAQYFIGTLPFALALLYFWNDMANDTYAFERIGPASFGVAVLFVWMKVWQNCFAHSLYTSLSDDEPATIPRVNRIRAIGNQTILHASGLIVIPLALIVLVPIGRVYAFYQNATVLDDGSDRTLRELCRDAWQQACLAERQNHLLIWLMSPLALLVAVAMLFVLIPIAAMITPTWTNTMLVAMGTVYFILLIAVCPFGMILAGNVTVTLFALPHLLRMFTGIQTPFAVTPIAIFSPTFFVIVCALTYVILDPFIKSAYALRCFYGESRESGTDLKVSFRRSAVQAGATLVALIVAILAWNPLAGAQGPEQTGVRPEVLDRSIQDTLSDRAYAWRMPPERPTHLEEGVLATVVNTINEWLVAAFLAVVRFISFVVERIFGFIIGERSTGDGGTSIRTTLEITLYILLGVLAAFILFLVWRRWVRRAQDPLVLGEIERGVPDLEDEQTTADELPEEGWIRLAQQHLETGDYRLAMRGFFLAGLARLGHANLIRLAKHKSNRDYARDLARIRHQRPELLPVYLEGMNMFERVWYGLHIASRDMLRRFVEIQNTLRTDVGPGHRPSDIPGGD